MTDPVQRTGIPLYIVERGLRLAEGTTFFGVKFEDMTRAELTAITAHCLWLELAKQREAGWRSAMVAGLRPQEWGPL